MTESSTAVRGERIAAGALLTGISQAVGMIAGGVLALLVAVTIGNTPSTDGFFAAYALYAMFVTFAQSTRTTVVARMVDDGDVFGGFSRFLSAAIVVVVVLGVATVGIGGPVASLITGTLPDDAEQTARLALAVLWPAIACQLLAALGAAALAARGRFGVPAIAFGVGGLTSIAAFAALQPALGVDALAFGILIGSVFTAGVTVAALWREGWRPSGLLSCRPQASASLAGLLVLAAIPLLLINIGYLISLAVFAHLGQGLVTDFTYAFAGINLLSALLSSSIMIPIAGALARTWDRRHESLLPHHLRVFSAGVLLLLPCIALVALVGIDLGGRLFTRFDDSDVRRMVGFFLALTPSLICGMALAVPEIALYTLGRYRAAAVRSIGVLGVHAAVCLVAGSIESIWLLAFASAISTGLSIVVLLGLIYGPTAPRVACALLLRLARTAAATALAWGAPTVVAVIALSGDASRWAAAVAGAPLYVLIMFATSPDDRALVRDLVASLSESFTGRRRVVSG